MLKNGLDATVHQPTGEPRAELSALEFVVKDVVHLDAIFHFFEMVLVVPHRVRTEALLVHEYFGPRSV